MHKRKVSILIRYYYTCINEKNILILFLLSWIVERGVRIFSILNVAERQPSSAIYHFIIHEQLY